MIAIDSKVRFVAALLLSSVVGVGGATKAEAACSRAIYGGPGCNFNGQCGNYLNLCVSHNETKASCPSDCCHSLCSVGEPHGGECSNACTDFVCQHDAYCCTNWWDEQCVAEANEWCGGGCGAYGF